MSPLLQQCDFNNNQQANDFLVLLDLYARDPMGGGEGLTADVKVRLIPQLKQRSDVVSVLCYVDGVAVGLITAIEGFSTFKAKPLLNIHDVVVLPEYRNLGLCQLMLAKIEELARERGCCKLTLEVLSNNIPAQKAYQQFGFTSYELDPAMGAALFWQKVWD